MNSNKTFIERKHYLVAGTIIALSFALQPFALVYFQMYAAPKLYDLMSKMQTKGEDQVLAEMNIDNAKYELCLANPGTQAKVEAEQKQGEQLGVNGTPNTFVAKRNQDGNFALYKDSINGAMPKDAILGAIDAAKKGFPGKDLINGANLKIYGNKDAQIFLIEFSDFECPFCKRFYPSIKQVVDESNGQVAMIYMHFPLSFHPKAMPWAIASECVYEQAGDTGFYKFHDAIFEGKIK